MFETETFGPCLVWNLNWRRGGAWPPGLPAAAPLSYAHYNKRIMSLKQ